MELVQRLYSNDNAWEYSRKSSTEYRILILFNGINSSIELYLIQKHYIVSDSKESSIVNII